jgi:hypothetical protein
LRSRALRLSGRGCLAVSARCRDMLQRRLTRTAAALVAVLLASPFMLVETTAAQGGSPAPASTPGPPTTPEAMATFVQTGINLGKANADATSYFWGAVVGCVVAALLFLALFVLGYQHGERLATARKAEVDKAVAKQEQEFKGALKARDEAKALAEEASRRAERLQEMLSDRDRQIGELNVDLSRDHNRRRRDRRD